jgi:hypothetical protein
MLSSKKQQAIGMFVFGLALLLLGAWMSGWIPTYAEYCEQNPQTHQKDCATYHIALIAVWQIGKILDASAAAITAIATGFIAWFTLILKRSTDRLWDAGERQLKFVESNTKESIALTQRAAEAAERSADLAERTIDAAEAPFLYPIMVGHTVTSTPDGFIESIGLGEMVQFKFKNFGRTPAILIDVYGVPSFALGLPRPLDDLVLHSGGIRTEVIGSGDESKVRTFNLNQTAYDRLFWAGLGSGNPNLLAFLIHVRYDDLYGNGFIARFCFAYAAGKKEWYCVGSREYNYRRKVEWPPPT